MSFSVTQTHVGIIFVCLRNKVSRHHFFDPKVNVWES